MKKKRLRKSSRSIKKRTSTSSYRSYLIIALGVFAVVLIGKAIIVSQQNSSTLGTTSYLAKGDDSDSGSSGSGGSGSSGSDSSGSGSSGSGSSGSDDSGSGSSGSGSSGSSGNTSGSPGTTTSPTRIPLRTETRDNETGIRTQTEMKEDDTRTEIRLSEGERIRTRTKDGRTRIDITSGGIKTRLEIRDDRVVIKAEQEDGTEVELEDDTLFKIDERLGSSGIKIATAGADKFVIQRGTAGAVTDFPLSIDLATNTLSVNTPSGTRTVTVLPDQAVQNLIAANVVNRLGGQAVVDAVRNNNLLTVSEVITLGEQNGVPIYEISGISDQKLLGFIPIKIEKEVTVSAETGEVVSIDVTLGDRILDLLSF